MRVLGGSAPGLCELTRFEPVEGRPPEQIVSKVKADPGGAMTDEVGVITGDLTVATRLLSDGHAGIAIQYTDADEWYTLIGSTIPAPPQSLAARHEEILERVRHGGGAEAPRCPCGTRGSPFRGTPARQQRTGLRPSAGRRVGRVR